MRQVPFCRRSETALNIAVEVNHIVIPAKDKRATAELLAYVLGLEVEGRFDESVRILRSNGLTLEFSECNACWAFQCAFLLSDVEFDAALSRIDGGAINSTPRLIGRDSPRSTVGTAVVASISTIPTAICLS